MSYILIPTAVQVAQPTRSLGKKKDKGEELKAAVLSAGKDKAASLPSVKVFSPHPLGGHSSRNQNTSNPSLPLPTCSSPEGQSCIRNFQTIKEGEKIMANDTSSPEQVHALSEGAGFGALYALYKAQQEINKRFENILLDSETKNVQEDEAKQEFAQAVFTRSFVVDRLKHKKALEVMVNYTVGTHHQGRG